MMVSAPRRSLVLLMLPELQKNTVADAPRGTVAVTNAHGYHPFSNQYREPTSFNATEVRLSWRRTLAASLLHVNRRRFAGSKAEPTYNGWGLLDFKSSDRRQRSRCAPPAPSDPASSLPLGELRP